MSQPKVHGYLFVTADKDQPLMYVPFDGTQAEFLTASEAPEEINNVAVQLADANNATYMGVVVDLGGVA